MPGRNTSPPRRLVSDELWALIEPRATLILITRWVFLTVRLVLGLLAGRKDYRGRDRVLALGGPFGLLALPVAWLVLVLVAYLVGLLAAARRARGIRAGSRALSCWRRGALGVIPDYATAPAYTVTDRDQPTPQDSDAKESSALACASRQKLAAELLDQLTDPELTPHGRHGGLPGQ